MDKTSICYNKSTRKWELLGEIGETLAGFPAGPDGRRQAIVAQLEIESPAALALALDIESRYPEMNGRAIRAAQILANGQIRAGRWTGHWQVDSQTNPRAPRHEVRYGRGYWLWMCSCQDWQRGMMEQAHGAPMIQNRDGRLIVCCKHITAIMMSQRLAETSDWPPRCPDCGGEMEIKRDGEGIPFWSCYGFPLRCRGRAEFQPHPDDAKAADNAQEALYRSLTRAQEADLMSVSARAQRRRREREAERLMDEFLALTNDGWSPGDAHAEALARVEAHGNG